MEQQITRTNEERLMNIMLLFFSIIIIYTLTGLYRREMPFDLPSVAYGTLIVLSTIIFSFGVHDTFFTKVSKLSTMKYKSVKIISLVASSIFISVISKPMLLVCLPSVIMALLKFLKVYLHNRY